jgi:hypothetical protein
MKKTEMALLSLVTAVAIVAAAWVYLDPFRDGARLLAGDARTWVEARAN